MTPGCDHGSRPAHCAAPRTFARCVSSIVTAIYMPRHADPPRILVTALASVPQPTGLAVYASEVGRRFQQADETVHVVSWPPRQGSRGRAIRRLLWLYTSLDAVARTMSADAVLHLLPEVGR